MLKYAICISWLWLFGYLQSQAQEVAVQMRIQQLLDSSASHSELGEYKGAYAILLEAKRYAEQSEHVPMNKWASIEHNLGATALRLANPTLARKHYLTSINLVMKQENPDQEQLYHAYSSLGILAWHTSKLDSAVIFFEKSIEAVMQIDDTPLNLYYRRARLYNNMAGVYRLQGKVDRTISMMETSISLLQTFMLAEGYEEEKKQAARLRFEATDNLGGLYKELGNYSKAEQLLRYSYTEKQKHLPKNDPAIFISQILLGQLYYDKADYKKSLQFLEQGRAAIRRSGSDYFFWDADACHALALVYEKQKDDKPALAYYKKADSLYHIAFNDSYDSFYLDFLRNYNDFQAQSGACGLAMQNARNALTYVLHTGNTESLLSFYQLRNLAELSLTCSAFEEARNYAQQALSLIDVLISQRTTLADSIKAEGEKAKVLLCRAKADYALLQEKNPEALRSLLPSLNEAVALIERKKRILTEQQDILLLIADYQDLSDFIKQLHFELYEQTNDKQYLQEGMRVHESNLYTRIRSRMDYQKTLQFANVPQSVLDEEKTLRQNMQSCLQQQKGGREQLVSYRASLDDWHLFLQKLKKQYPNYYRMRYAEKGLDLDGIAHSLPADVTVVRYVFSEKSLYALVVSKKRQALISLNASGLSEQIARSHAFGQSAKRVCKAAYRLYVALWQPLEKEIATHRVVVIPDGILHQLNFEMLTPVATQTFAALAEKCLLHQYAFSYHYSLLALSSEHRPAKPMKGNFVAFAPGFSEASKQQYLAVAEQGSFRLDNAYLSLLPLPFTEKLVDKVRKKFGGNVFSHARSTRDVFRRESAHNHIIHIGTHAEANNDYPEYSRLIFAKDAHDPEEENSVYLYDIYNVDLTSDLSVLTACESGKPGYQDGEGMISMAHAFNYAGSRSIMAGLWKLYEQAATMITECFYVNVRTGLPKDIALQKAKLLYLQQAEGRMLSPAYWSGLALMGDMKPISLDTSSAKMYYGIGLSILLLLAGWWAGRSRKDGNVPRK